jgi:hypothetical protein
MGVSAVRYATGQYATTGDLTTAGGLVFITSSTFSAAASVNVNNCFTSAYENYRILCSATGSTTIQNLGMRLRAAGADASGANYAQQYLAAASTTVSGARATGQTSIPQVALVQTTDVADISMDIFHPAQAAPTTVISTASREPIAAISIWSQVGYHSLSTAYDGFSLIPAAGTITGTVRVYGYKNS